MEDEYYTIAKHIRTTLTELPMLTYYLSLNPSGESTTIYDFTIMVLPAEEAINVGLAIYKHIHGGHVSVLVSCGSPLVVLLC